MVECSSSMATWRAAWRSSAVSMCMYRGRSSQASSIARFAADRSRVTGIDVGVGDRGGEDIPQQLPHPATAPKSPRSMNGFITGYRSAYCWKIGWTSRSQVGFALAW